MVIGKLLGDLLGIPMNLTKKTIEGFLDAVDKERLITEESVKEKLQELQLQLQDGQISEEEYAEQETWLIERLKAIREYHSQGGK